MIGLKRLMAIGLIALILFVAVPATALTSNNIYQVIQDDGSFNKLVSVIRATNQGTSLTVAGPFTVLAPTDDAFNKLPATSINGITSDRFKRNSFMRNLMISGKYTTDQMVSMGSVRTLDGRRITVTRASDGSVMIGGAKIVKPNIEARNGIIQGVDGVIMPG
jgi:uncharacterized surface protein with fasciclin (FAS1) repeats